MKKGIKVGGGREDRFQDSSYRRLYIEPTAKSAEIAPLLELKQNSIKTEETCSILSSICSRWTTKKHTNVQNFKKGIKRGEKEKQVAQEPTHGVWYLVPQNGPKLQPLWMWNRVQTTSFYKSCTCYTKVCREDVNTPPLYTFRNSGVESLAQVTPCTSLTTTSITIVRGVFLRCLAGQSNAYPHRIIETTWTSCSRRKKNGVTRSSTREPQEKNKTKTKTDLTVDLGSGHPQIRWILWLSSVFFYFPGK